MSDLQSLAAEVLAVLALQSEYFKARNPATLVACKAAESKLRKRCKAIVGWTKDEPDLFKESAP